MQKEREQQRVILQVSENSKANGHRIFLQIIQLKSDDYLWQMQIDVGLCGLWVVVFCTLTPIIAHLEEGKNQELGTILLSKILYL